MRAISLAEANKIIDGTFASAEKRQAYALAAIVLDAGGRVKAFQKQDGASLMRFEIAYGKAFGALALNRWFHALVTGYEARVLLVDQKVAEEWGRMNAVTTLPAIDSLLAATARVHGLTLVTRNTRDVAPTGVPCLNPFAG